MTTDSRPKKGLTGWHVLFITLAAFGVVFAVNITFIVLSLETFTGVEVPDAYEQGLAYNQTLEERAEQAALGWTASFGAAQIENGKTHVTVDLADADGAPVTGAAVSILFRRSTHDGQDTTFTLGEVGGGAYAAEVALRGAGLWDVRGHAERDEGERLDFEDRIWLE